MFVLFLTGRSAGQVEEMKYADAAALIADGRAKEVDYGAMPAPAIVVTAEDPRQAELKAAVEAAAAEKQKANATTVAKRGKRRA